MIGRNAPDFTLFNQSGSKFNLYENLTSKVMLVFYPKDESPVCTKQLCEYSNNLDRLLACGIKVVAINNSGKNSHKTFAAKNSINFPIMEDPKFLVSKLFGAVNIFGFNKRKIVIVNENKKIIYTSTVFPIKYQRAESIIKTIMTL